jgi:hypothetical protein
MDLSFSPDSPAWVCYLIVLLFGVLTGWREVVAQLKDTYTLWRYPSAWVLMVILGIGPVLLFWMLDRVGALHDTSVIAAAIVGIAYTQILKGDSQYKAPGETSPIWNFLSWWRERIAKAVQDHVTRNALAFDQIVSGCLAAPAKPGKAAPAAAAGPTSGATPLQEVTALALKHAIDPVKLQAALEAERSRLKSATPPLSDEVIDYKIAEFIYREIQGDPGYRNQLVSQGLIEQSLVDRYFGSRWSRVLAIVAIAAAFVVTGLFVVLDRTGTVKYVEREYLMLRLSKATGTVNDLDRVTARLIERVAAEPRAAAGKPVAADFWLMPLLAVLNDSTLPMDRVNATLRVFLATRDKDVVDRHSLAERLITMLRGGNVDARRRVHLALVYLAPDKAESSAEFKALRAWNPTEGDSITEIESKIDDWRAYWEKIKP